MDKTAQGKYRYTAELNIETFYKMVLSISSKNPPTSCAISVITDYAIERYNIYTQKELYRHYNYEILYSLRVTILLLEPNSMQNYIQNS